MIPFLFCYQWKWTQFMMKGSDTRKQHHVLCHFLYDFATSLLSRSLHRGILSGDSGLVPSFLWITGVRRESRTADPWRPRCKPSLGTKSLHLWIHPRGYCTLQIITRIFGKHLKFNSLQNCSSDLSTWEQPSGSPPVPSELCAGQQKLLPTFLL